MAYVDKAWYADFGDGATTGYYAIATWATAHAYSVGNIVRQAATPTVGNERSFVCIVAGTSGGTEPSWVVSRGNKTTDNTVTWMETSGIAALNGDLTNTLNWTQFKAISTTPSLGNVIKDVAGTHIFICTTTGVMGASEPSWNTTAVGNTTTDSTTTWTYLGTSFSNWASPNARLHTIATSANYVASNSYMTLGNNSLTVFVATESVETRSGLTTWSSIASVGAPLKILSVTKTTVPPTNVTTGATYGVTGSSFGIGSCYLEVYGMNFTGSSTMSPGFTGGYYYKDCTFDISSGGTNTYINIVNSGSNNDIVYENCTFKFPSQASTGLTISGANSTTRLINPSFSYGATKPTNLFANGGQISAGFLCEAGDFSGFAGTNLIQTTLSQANFYQGVFKNCKLPSGVNLMSASPGYPGQRVTFLNCDTSGNLRDEVWDSTGTLTTEKTIIRTGGASDGTTGYSYKIVTTANTVWSSPFDCIPLYIWNDTTGSAVTVTVYGIWGGGAVPNNDDIWIDVAYKGDSGSPLDTWVRGSKANPLVSNSAQTSDTSTWGGSTTKFKMSATFTPQQKGYITVYPKVGATSSTFYIDPQPVLS